MPYIEYVPKKFSPGSMRIINLAEAICTDYASRGFDLTLRQLYYQFVARGHLPNRDTEYKRLGSIINDARLAGLIDWDHIIDRTRNARSLNHWNAPADIVHDMAGFFNIDKWATQPLRIEVWIEKDALVGVIDTTCRNEDVTYFSCRGYTSQSEVWGAAQRINTYLWAGQDVIVLHLGDHDPSGIDMSRDIRDRLRLFTQKDKENHMIEMIQQWGEEGKITWGEDGKLIPEDRDRVVQWLNEWQDTGCGRLTIKRIALNMDQVEEYDPPPNPAKLTDSRSGSYVENYGDDSWELDALDPAVLSALITEEIENARDQQAWDEAVEAEDEQRALLRQVSERWDDIRALLEAS